MSTAFEKQNKKGIRNRRLQMEALQHLVQLLPPANRDTLYRLLSFLAVVAAKSNDHQTVDGDWESGNKMDSNNLATLFAPNLLHTIKPGTTTEKLAAESVARAGERIDVINVIRSMIDHYQDVFKVSLFLFFFCVRLIILKFFPGVFRVAGRGLHPYDGHPSGGVGPTFATPLPKRRVGNF